MSCRAQSETGGALGFVPIISGPTAVGKTSVGVEVARALGKCVISADSMQVYRFMDIGTAAPTIEEIGNIPHYFVRVIRPDQSYNAAVFGRHASHLSSWLFESGRPPIVVGGARLFIRALTHGIFPQAASDTKIRDALAERAGEIGSEGLHAELARSDPVTAQRLHPRDLKRIVRALEVMAITGKPMSEIQTESTSPAPFRFHMFILWGGREWIYERIRRRTKEMFRCGFLDEVRRLVDMGYAEHLDRIRANGYREALAYLRGEIGEEELFEQMDRAIRHNARYQIMWMRQESDATFIDCEKSPDDAAPRIIEHIKTMEVP